MRHKRPRRARVARQRAQSLRTTQIAQHACGVSVACVAAATSARGAQPQGACPAVAGGRAPRNRRRAALVDTARWRRASELARGCRACRCRCQNAAAAAGPARVAAGGDDAAAAAVAGSVALRPHVTGVTRRNECGCDEKE